MGQQTSSSNVAASKNAASKNVQATNKWCSEYDDVDRYFMQCSDPITSDGSVEKKPGTFGGETWGPYTKKLTTSWLGTSFIAPASVDGIPILCQCRDITKYVGKAGVMTLGRIKNALGGGDKPVACWDDASWLPGGTSTETFYINVNDPAFKVNAAVSLVGLFAGGSKTRRKRKTKLERRSHRSKRKQQ
jgi:hypothetical protein